MIGRRKTARLLRVQQLENRWLLASDVGFCLPSPPSEREVPGLFAQPAQPQAPLAAGGSATNPAAPYDPSGDGWVTPLDALQVLNYLVAVQRGESPTAETQSQFDVNRDGAVTPLDALEVISEIGQAQRSGFSAISVPQVTLLQGAGDDGVVDDLSVQLSLLPGVQTVYVAVAGADGLSSPEEITSLRQENSLALSHEELLARLGPIADGPVELQFWTDDPQRLARTHLTVAYQAPEPPPRPDRILWSEGAENGTRNVIDRTHSAYPLIQSAVRAAGNRAFHLAHSSPALNGFEIDRTIRVEEDTQLYFMSRLGWAATGQVAEVQLSTNGGASWPHTLYSQAGSSDSGEGAFALRQVDLSAFSGQDIRLRFVYQVKSGSYYPQTDPGFGWYVDNIQIGNYVEKIIYDIGNPTAYQQQYLEYINRARADALAEARRLANLTDRQITAVYTSFGIDPRDIVFQYTQQVNSGEIARRAPPLSFNAALLEAAQLHTQDLYTNRFQGHNSSAKPPAPFRSGYGPRERASALGYVGGVAENVYSHSRSVAYGHAAFAVDWGGESPGHPDYNPLFAGQGMQNPAGHRLNLHNDRANEIGIGVINATNGPVGPQLVTQDFGLAGNSTFITGVVFEDLNGNRFYDIGEGRPDVRVDVDGSGYYAISASSGGYSVPVSADGRYTVTFSGAGFETYTVTSQVSEGRNVKVDYLV